MTKPYTGQQEFAKSNSPQLLLAIFLLGSEDLQLLVLTPLDLPPVLQLSSDMSIFNLILRAHINSVHIMRPLLPCSVALEYLDSCQSKHSITSRPITCVLQHVQGSW